jgi:hypothetical protein
MVCIVESLGNYQVIAAASQERPPPSSAINRGMLFEGKGNLDLEVVHSIMYEIPQCEHDD